MDIMVIYVYYIIKKYLYGIRPSRRGGIMAVINYTGKNLRTYEVSRHKHDFWEFIYCTGGDGVITFEDGKVIKYTQYQW